MKVNENIQQLLRFQTLAVLFFLLPRCVFAQFELIQSNDIEVEVDGQIIQNAWCGGFNAPQVSMFDANDDGIDDLFTLDRDGSTPMVFINTSDLPGNPNYVYDPIYSSQFPNLRNWALMRDYNCDGKKDIFTNFQSGISLYKNTSQDGVLSFELVEQQLQCEVTFGSSDPLNVPLTCLSIDIPAIDDYDGDGDLDIVTWTETATTIYFYTGLGVDNGNCENIAFEMTNRCYGMLSEGAESNTLFIGNAYAEDVTPPDGIPDRCGFNVANPRVLGEGGDRDGLHTGGTLCSVDLDQNGIKDLLIGDITYNNLIAAYMADAVDLQDSTTFTDVAFPASLGSTVPVDLQKFPAGYYEDFNNDGIKDLLVASNSVWEMDDDNGMWLYLNENEDDLPVLSFQETDWLQNTSIDHGRGAHPVLVDVNNDGLKDLIVANEEYYNGFGDRPSQLAYYENTGSADNPSFVLIDDNYANIPLYQLEHIHPTFGDLDGDGDLDMILGENEGRMHYFVNNADPGAPMDLALGIPALTDNNNELIDIGKSATPFLFDMDGDGLLDIVAGEQNGNLNYFLNVGTAQEFSFELQVTPFGNDGEKFGNVQANNLIGINGHSVPFIWEEDGQILMLVANEVGQMQYFDNISNNLNGEFNQVEEVFQGIDHSEFAGAWFEDINNDNHRDLFIGNNRGGLWFFYGEVGDSIDEIAALEEALIYPNPTSGNINVSFSEPLRGEVSLIDLSGRTVYNNGVSYSDRVQLDVNLPKGMYLVQFNSNEGINKVIGKVLID